VADLLAHDPAVDALVRLTPDDLDLDHVQPGWLKERLEGATTLIHLGRSDAVAELDGTGTAGVDVVASRALLDAAGSVGVQAVVQLPAVRALRQKAFGALVLHPRHRCTRGARATPLIDGERR
jgi:hypothetical protein